MARRGRPESGRWRQVLPGLAILAVLVVTSIATFFMDTIRRLTAEGPRIVVTAAKASGLQRGSTVWVAGIPAGRVLQVRYGDPGSAGAARVVVDVILRRDAMADLRTDARAAIGSSALLAPAVLKISPGTAGTPALRVGDTLPIFPALDLESFRELADSARVEFEALRADASLLRERLLEGPGSASGFLGDPALLALADSARRRSGRVATALREGEGLARLARDDSLRRDLADAKEALTALGILSRPFVDSLTGLADRSASVRTRASRIGAGLEAAEGTAGRALQDPALRDRSRETRDAIRSVAEELGANPLRWLRIRLF